MLKLSNKTKIYLLLLETGFVIFTLILGVFLVDTGDTKILAKNLLYQFASLFLNSFIYINIYTINKNFKISSILKFVIITLTFFSNLVLYHIPLKLFLNPEIFKIIDSVIDVLTVPFIYFYYKGFCVLSKDVINNITLFKKWNFLLIIKVILTVFSYIFTAIFNTNFIKDAIIQNGVIAIMALLLSFGSMIFVLVIGILEIIYIIKTAKAL
ncbi:MAG: hypothetical protein E7537_02185 [Ruminococcaceae bacterium]|nr:hypothetical protein [Oscillospiraceae bacterium]